MALRWVVIAAVLPLLALGEGTCKEDATCKLKTPLQKPAWWRSELNSAQPECKAIDPQNLGTCHQWTVELSDNAQQAVHNIKTTVSDYIKTTMKTTARSRVLSWNDQMDELYLSAPKHAVGSDKVFVTPHIDGFFGIIPFMTAWRCVYGLTGPHATTTIQPMRDGSQREVILGPESFTCFDYNREIHWIENRVSNTSVDERMVLKLHFYEYPALFQPVADYFGHLNAQYNFLARAAFLASQFPDRSFVSKFIGGGINLITDLGGSFERFYGYMNMGFVVTLFMGVRCNLFHTLLTVGLCHYAIYFLVFLFRANTLGMFMRDAIALKVTSVALLAYTYMRDFRTKPHALSFVVAAAGFLLSAFSAFTLGGNLTYYGKELGKVAPDVVVTAWPYGGAFAIPHPMILGAVVSLAGLRLHPTYGPKFHKAFIANVACYAAVLGLEISNLHLPSSMTYDATYEDFAAYHQNFYNIMAHLLTTGVAFAGVIGLCNHAVRASSKSEDKNTLSLTPLVTGLTWILVRYTGVDDDAAFMTVGFMAVLALAVQARGGLSILTSIVLIVAGTLAQEIAHHASKEVTFMASYAAFSPEAMLTFALHNVWLVPFEIRSAINAMTAVLVPATAPAGI